MTLARGCLDSGLATGLMFVCQLPSTVQSSIAFTSIARGKVPAALCAASVSNLAGVVITPLLATMFLSAHSGGLTPYEAICRAWADKQDRFRSDPVHLTSGLNT